MSKLTDFLSLLKGEENDYFDYTLYLNNNWDKIDNSLKLLYNRDNGIYVNETSFGAVGDANFSKTITVSGKQITTWYVDALFKTPAKDNYDAIVAALNKAQTTNTTLNFPKGNYYISKELLISQITVDILFEQGTKIIGDIKIQDISDITFNNLTVNGNVNIDSARTCQFLNFTVNGKTTFGTTLREKNNIFNTFINCEFSNSIDKGFELYCDELVVNSNKNIEMNTSNNTFINCNFTGQNYGIYSDVADEILNSKVSDNIFINCKSSAINADKAITSIYLGRKTEAFQFIGHESNGLTIAIDTTLSTGQNSYVGGSINGLTNGGLNGFSIFTPAVSSDTGFEKNGSNINNMRKMKVFNYEIPKWTRYNVTVSNDNTISGITGADCLKITNGTNDSFPTLERKFTPSEHLNQTINVMARVRCKKISGTSDAAIILTNGSSNDIVTSTINADDNWKIISAKITQTQDKDITVKFTSNNSYGNVINELYIDWLVITLGDVIEFGSIPVEEHHYGDLTHYGNFLVTNDIEVTDPTKGVVLHSPDGTRFRLTIQDDGVLTATEVETTDA